MLRTELAPVKYLGSKRGLLAAVVPAIQKVWRGGRIVDGFSGMATVGLAASEFAPVTCVDTQVYSWFVARALVVRGASFGNSVRQAKRLLDGAQPRFDGFFSTSYAESYFTTSQAAQIDGVRAQIKGKYPTASAADSLLTCALFHAMSKAVAAPGHFAQPLNPNKAPRERGEGVLERAASFLDSLERNIPMSRVVGKNAAVVGDVTAALEKGIPDLDVVFADPPYSTAQYSRFYHLLETAALNDRPRIEGKGGYRSGRFQSPFCQKARVREAFDGLVQTTAELKASLVLTYPSNAGHLNGLAWSAEDVVRLARKRYRSVSVNLISTRQSRLGAAGRLDRVEAIIVAQSPR